MNLPKEVSDAVLKVMHKVGYIQKTGNNSFHGYKYASIEGVLEKVQPALVECGLAIVQSEVSHDVIGDGNLMEAVYEFTLCSGGVCSTPVKHTGLSSLRNTKGGYDDKALNKCHTAARKYFILGVFQIPTGLEADADAEEDKPHKPAPRRDAPAPSLVEEYQKGKGEKAAKAFVDEFIKEMGKATEPQHVDAMWLGKKAQLDRLKSAYPDQFRYLEAASQDTLAAFIKDAAE